MIYRPIVGMTRKPTHLDKKVTIQLKDNSELKECQNCGYKDRGNFCSNCGQRFTALNRPMKDILAEVGDIVNLDSRIFRSIPPFLFKPGLMTREYLEQATSNKISEAGDIWLQVTADTTDAVRDDSTALSKSIRKAKRSK
jgi:hypothetical protein